MSPIVLKMGPVPYLATCERCGERIPPFEEKCMPLKKFLAEIEAVRERHTSCQEEGDGADEAALRRTQPQAGEDADEEAERAAPASSDGAVAAPGSVEEADDHDSARACPCRRCVARFHQDLCTWPLPNVWLGTSVEDQAAADTRIPELLATPAAVRFLSCEPLLGPVDIFGVSPDMEYGVGFVTRGVQTKPHDVNGPAEYDVEAEPGIDWVIGGGESGTGARPCDLAWLRSLRDQCAAAGVAYFNKQLGSRPRIWHEAKLADAQAGRDASQYHPLPLKHGHGGNPEEWPEDLRRREWPVSR